MASNYFSPEPDDNKSYQKTVAMCVAAASLVILLFLVILYVNSDTGSHKTQAAKPKTEAVEEDDILKDSHNMTSDELEFWKDEKKKKPAKPAVEEEGELTPYKDPEKKEDTDRSETDEKNGSTDKPARDDNEEGEGSLNKESEAEDKYGKDGYITITDEKGKKTYYEIIKDLAKNDYDLENNLINENGMLSYRDNKREAIKGVDLSKYNGAVDFNKLKDSGVGFAMLRLGSRGYGTGKITLDEKFVEYAQNAQMAGIQIGAYFYSQAINDTEAVEESHLP